MKKILSFPFTLWMTLFLVFTLSSCGRTPNIPDHLDHDFVYGTTDGLYRIRDLHMILNEEAVKSQTDSRSNKQPPSIYENIVPENFYANSNLKANISSLKELLRIRTVKKGGKKVKIFSSLENIFIDPEISFLNEYEVLDYEITEPKTKRQEILKQLLGKVRDFHGFPDTDYYILPHFIGNYLILYKLGPPDKIPYDELPLAKRIGGMLAVPFVGYSVEYCQAVRFLDSNLRETLQFRPLCKGIKPSKPVKYIRLLAHKKQVFQYLKKQDFFQKDFFKGQWLHFRTLVRSSISRTQEIEHTKFKSAQLVEFRPSLGKMDVVEVYNLKKDDEKRVLFIPVKWTDYEIARDLENLHSSFSERLRENIHEVNRPYVEIKFNELINNEFEFQEKGGKSLKSVVITKDYISFDIEITTKGRVAYMMKYAFKRYTENTDYIEKQWFKKDDVLFFPMSAISRKYYKDPTDHTLTDENRFQRVIRFDPKAKEIKWYFSKQTSQMKWIRDLGHEAVRLLNTALQEAGKNSDYEIKMILDKSGADKEIGDIRYNIINLILSEGESAEQFKLGRNIANPLTGEVVSAVVNVWLNYILKEYISIVRRYIRFHVYPPAWKMKPFSKDMMTFIHDNVETKNLQCGDLSHEPLPVTPFLHEKINSICKEVSHFIEKHKEGTTFHPRNSFLQDDEAVSSCAQKLARVKILQAIVHSMIHSLGLKDMTSASADSENFYKQNEIKTLFGRSDLEVTTKSHPDPPQYSSVMDRIDLEYPILSVPGKMDIAALRFVYFDKVEKAAKGFLHVPSGADRDPENPQKSILQTVDAKGYSKEDLKEYKVCGWDAGHPLFCQGTDYGISPLEVVSNSICKAHNYLLSKRNRYDRKNVTGGVTVSHSIKAMYTRWAEYRDDILAAKGKSIFSYSFLNPNDIKKYSQLMEGTKNYPDIKPYYAVRNVIFDYFKRMAFAPAKYCIYKERSDRDGEFYYNAIALENIEEKILHQYPENSEKAGEVFMSCESQIVKDWAGKDKTLVTEVGFFGKDRKYFIRPNEKTDPIDEKTAFQLTMNAIINRFDFLLQDPELGAEYYREWLAYITEGIDLNPYIDRNAIKDLDTPKDTQFNRVPSYEIDTMKGVRVGPIENLQLFREQSIKKYKEESKKNYPSVENLQLLSLHFSYLSFSSTDLQDYAESTPTHPDLHNEEIPFLIQAYEEYEDNKEDHSSFTSFIQTHPAVLYKPDSSIFLLPYTDEEINVMARLFRQYNEFSKCIDEEEANIKTCDGIDSKRAFVKFMLNTYK